MSVKSKVAELLALRDSVSESAVSIERFADEEAVREHVLRPAVSISSIGLRGSASVPAFRARMDGGRSSTTVNSLLAAPIAGSVNIAGSTHANGHKKPSPTPSLKRDKVRRLIKEHGSPPGLRVTAGGRIVPHDMPSLGSPQYPVQNDKMGEWSYGDSRGNAMQRAISQPPFIRRASDAVPPPAFEPMSRSESSNTAVNTTIPAYTHGYNANLMPFFFPAPHFAFAHAPTRSFTVSGPPSGNANKSATAEIAGLRKMLDRIHIEQRDLEREMVIRESGLTADERRSMVERKVHMINESDRIRKDIKHLESGEYPSSSPFEHQAGPLPQHANLVATQAGPQPGVNAFVFANAPAGFMPLAPGPQFPAPYMFPNLMPLQSLTPLDGTSSVPNGEDAAPPPENADEPTRVNDRGIRDKPGKLTASGPRRSHALEIKDPNKASEQKITDKRSVLDPTSPAYTPQKKSKSDTSHEDSSLVFVPPSPSPIASPHRDAAFAAHFPWLCSDDKMGEKNDSATKASREPSVKSSAHRPSTSSINTADFFPNNPQEHSSVSYNARTDAQDRQVTPDRPSIAWTSVFTSPDQRNSLLKAPQVTPVDGRFARHDSVLGVSQPDSHASRSAPQARTSQTTSRQNSNEKIKVSSGHAWPRAESSRMPSAAAAPPSVGQLDFRGKSVTFLLGFSAGLSGQPIQGTEDVDYMQGWTQGLLSAKQSSSRQPSESSASPVSEDQTRPHQHKMCSDQRRSCHLHPESGPYRHREESIPPPIGHVQSSTTAVHKVSSATLRASLSTQSSRPVAARFETSETSRSISSSMGVGPATVSTPYRTVSGETDKTITDKIDATASAQQTPMTQRSGNERDESRPLDRSNQSPSKLARVFSGQQPPLGQSQHKPGRGFNLNCLGDQREQARQNRTSYDGADDMQDEQGPLQTGESMNARISPSKGSVFTDSPSASTGSPKKISKAAVKHKIEEVASNVSGGAAKGKRGRKTKKIGHDEADEPSKMSREEKKNWREMWKRRFEEIRNDEQREIDRYREENPLPQ